MSSVLVRRRYACAYEAGPRPVVPLLPPFVPADGLFHPATAYCSAVTDEPLVALTYDDGPDPRHTPGVLDALAQTGTRATFFVLLERAEAHPDLIRRMVAEGHEVGLHGADHRRVSTDSVGSFVIGLLAARRRLQALTGQRPRWYRPAYGAIRLPQLLAVHALGLDVPVWTAWARDWENATVDVLVGRAASALHPGGVLLLHDATSGLPTTEGPPTPEPTFHRGELTRRLIAAARQQGYALGSLGDMAAAHPQARVLWYERKAEARRHAGPQPADSALPVVR